MTVYLSHRSERLIDLLAYNLKGELSFFDPPEVWVANGRAKQELELPLAEALGGFLGGAKIVSWQEGMEAFFEERRLPKGPELTLALYGAIRKEPSLTDQDATALALQLTPLFQTYLHRAPRLSGWQKRLFDQVFNEPYKYGKGKKVPSLHLFLTEDFTEFAPLFSLGIPLHIYLFSPSIDYWGEGQADSFLSRYGGSLQKTLKALEPFHYQTIEAYEPLPDFATQASLLTSGSLGEKEERIIQIQAGASRLEEIEALADEVARLRPGSLAELVVAAPDLNEYVGLIPLFFPYPHRLEGIHPPPSAYQKRIEAYLELEDRDWDCDLFNAIDPTWSDALSDLTIRHGYEAFQKGVEELLLELAICQDAPRLESASIQDLPKVLALQEKISEIKRLTSSFIQGVFRLPAEFASLLELLPESEEREGKALVSFIGKLKRVKNQEPVPWELIRGLLKREWSRLTFTKNAHLLEAVRFVSLDNGPPPSCRHLFLLGMNKDEVPPRNITPSYDVVKQGRADRIKSHLLQGLFAPSESLTILYRHLDPFDGTVLLPTFEELPCQSRKRGVLSLPKGRPKEPIAQRPALFRTLLIRELAELAKYPWRTFFKKQEGLSLFQEQGERKTRLSEFFYSSKEKMQAMQGMLPKRKIGGLFGQIAERDLRQRGRVRPLRYLFCESEGTHIQVGDLALVGQLEAAEEGFPFYFGLDRKRWVEKWPEVLIYLTVKPDGSLIDLKNGKSFIVPPFDVKRALERYVAYAQEALTRPICFDLESASWVSERFALKEEEREHRFQEALTIYETI
jgi:hypothetical protein